MTPPTPSPWRVWSRYSDTTPANRDRLAGWRVWSRYSDTTPATAAGEVGLA